MVAQMFERPFDKLHIDAARLRVCGRCACDFGGILLGDMFERDDQLRHEIIILPLQNARCFAPWQKFRVIIDIPYQIIELRGAIGVVIGFAMFGHLNDLLEFIAYSGVLIEYDHNLKE